MSRNGSCLCGTVSYELDARPERAGACHCGMCRKFSGGVYLAFEVPAGGVTFRGEEMIGTYTSSEWAERCFCKTCGSSLFYRLTMEGPMQGTHHFALGTLDDANGIAFEGEIFIDRKPDVYDFAGDHMRMTEAEFMASIGAAS